MALTSSGYARTFYGPRNFELWSSDVDDTQAGTESLPYTTSLQRYWARTHDMPAMIRYLDHWATTAPRGTEDTPCKGSDTR
ncbi:hypothetical protein TNCV_4204051 [Trichonephila clavipes]|nr:hypothetical protein TNCV_4204051 [Trichonephila clavipes]